MRPQTPHSPPAAKWWFIVLLLLVAGISLLYLNRKTPEVPPVDAFSIPPSNSFTATDSIPPAPEAVPESILDKPQVAIEPSFVSPSSSGIEPLIPEDPLEAVHQVETTVYMRANSMFEREPVDADWAAAYESSLQNMFSQHQGLQRVSVNSIKCHSTMCRIEVFTPRDTDADFFTAMFYEGLATYQDGALKAEAAIARNMENGMTSVYVARKDHVLGFY